MFSQDDNSVTVASQMPTSGSDQMNQLCATIEISQDHTRILNNIGIVENGEARFIDLTSIQHVSRAAAVPGGQNFQSMYVMDDKDRMVPLEQCNISDLANGTRDISGCVSKVLEAVLATSSRGSPGNSLQQTTPEVMYEEIAVYKPVIAKLDQSFHDACREIITMQEERKLKQQSAVNNSAVGVDFLNNYNNLPEILLYYKNLSGDGEEANEATFLWRASYIEDFNQHKLELGGFMFEQMYFKHQRVAFEQNSNSSGNSSKNSNDFDLNQTIFERHQYHRTSSSPRNLPRIE
jgi:hypothetical protein